MVKFRLPKAAFLQVEATSYRCGNHARVAQKTRPV